MVQRQVMAIVRANVFATLSNTVAAMQEIVGKRLDAQIHVDNILNEYSYSGVNLSSSLLGGTSVLLALPTKRTAGARITYRF